MPVGHPVTSDQKAKIVAMRLAGGTWAEIARAVGLKSPRHVMWHPRNQLDPDLAARLNAVGAENHKAGLERARSTRSARAVARRQAREEQAKQRRLAREGAIAARRQKRDEEAAKGRAQREGAIAARRHEAAEASRKALERREAFAAKWPLIERDYSEGALSVVDIARKHGVASGTIHHRAAEEEWQRSCDKHINAAVRASAFPPREAALVEQFFWDVADMRREAA